jgi:uncharacterized protein (TIGR03382 family)
MMSRFGKWLPAMLVVFGFALLGAPRNAHAVLVLEGTITVDAQTPIIVFASDNNSLSGSAPAGAIILPDTDPAANTILLAPGVIVPGYSVSSASDFSTKALGSNNLSSNALQIVNNTGSSVATNIVVSDNNFVGPANTVSGTAGGTLLNAAGSTYSVAFFNDPTNTQFLSGTAPGNQVLSNNFGAVPVTPNPFTYPGDNSGDVSLAIPDPSAFGMSLQFTFTLVNGGTFISRGQSELKTNVVPEPAPIALALAGLPVLGLIWSRRRRPQA